MHAHIVLFLFALDDLRDRHGGLAGRHADPRTDTPFRAFRDDGAAIEAPFGAPTGHFGAPGMRRIP